MTRLGISVYPEHSTPEKDKAYIQLAGKYGFKRIFTCLLSVEGKDCEEVVREFREMNDFAHDQGMEVIMDVSPAVFERLGISYDDLSLFVRMHADGIRLDEGFDGMKESIMTYNKEGLKIELNSSIGNRSVDNIVSNFPNKNQLLTCHNFYPQRYSGLGLDFFTKCSENMKKHDLKTAAFVTSQCENTFGPWEVYEGLCTLEMHRDWPIGAQVRHLFATRLIDDVIIGNAYASEEELKICAAVKPGELTFGIELEKELTPLEREILYFSRKHINRGDQSDYMIRSSLPRYVYADQTIPADNTRALKRGDVVILNDGYGRYKGELQIVLKDMPNDGKKNAIGHIPQEELVLLDYAEPCRVFGFVEV